MYYNRSTLTDAPNSAKFRGGGGGAEGQPRFDKGGLQYFLFTFYEFKISLFRILRYKKVPFLEFLRKAIKKDSHLRIFTL